VTRIGRSIAVASGKGGVGKSTIAVNLALALAEGARVGILDADVYGPNVPLMLNVARTEALRRWDLWRGGEVRLEPIERFGIRVMSVGLLLGEEQSLPFGAQTLGLALRQFVDGTDWGDLDYLVVDLPPGTADLQHELLRTVRLDGALVVVGPQDAAHLDAKRVIDLLSFARVRILGGVENMAGLVCPHCGGHIEVFPPVADDRSLWHLGVRKLASLPLDPATTSNGRGPLLVAQPRSEQAERFRALARIVDEELASAP
jgi:ATP-binding protein involved in chromosome partitioning